MNMSYETFVDLRCNDKSGNLFKLSKMKKESPELFDSYNSRYNKACDNILRQANNGTAKRDRSGLFNKTAILANS